MRYLPRNIEISFGHAGLTHYGGILFFNEFSRMLQLRRFLTCLQGWTERILRRFHKVNPWRPEATFAKIERLMQTFWRQMLDFRPLLKEKSEMIQVCALETNFGAAGFGQGTEAGRAADYPPWVIPNPHFRLHKKELLEIYRLRRQ